MQKILVAIRDRNSSCKFINFSSAAVYGNPKFLPITENSVCKPLFPYGFHKLQSELLLTEYYNFFGLKTCSLRVFSAYGPLLKKQLFWDLYQKAIQNDTISLLVQVMKQGILSTLTIYYKFWIWSFIILLFKVLFIM